MDRLTAKADLARCAEDRLGMPVDVVVIRRELSLGLLFDIFFVETILYARDPVRGLTAWHARREPSIETSGHA